LDQVSFSHSISGLADPEMDQLLKRLPAKTVADVDALERDLGNVALMTRLVSTPFSVALAGDLCVLTAWLLVCQVHVLSQYGGADPGATTRGTLRKILTDNVQDLYSWDGKRGKLKFSSLTNIKKAIEGDFTLGISACEFYGLHFPPLVFPLWSQSLVMHIT